jgi:hypothetical protein
MHTVWDTQRSLCVGLVGSICSDNPGGLKCTKNAECDEGKCVCREGYGVTSKLTCMMNHGELCGPYQCNIDRGLACKSGSCQCLDSSYVYSAVSRRCFDPEGFLANLIHWFSAGLLRESLHRFVSKMFRAPGRVIRLPRRFIFRMFG